MVAALRAGSICQGLRVGILLAQLVLPSRATDSQCGTKGADDTAWARVVNGQQASACEWKWQACLKTPNEHACWCGGTLINETWVLSAAHCVAEGNKFNVMLGDFDHTSKADGTEVEVEVRRVISHPQYNDETMEFDFALIELVEPVEMNECIGTACLPKSDMHVGAGETCYISGWGTLSSGGDQPDKIQEAELTTLSNQECMQKGYGEGTITDDMLCAQGETEDGQVVDGCQGDSGGPLVCQADGVWYVQGATSWGNGCASRRFPGIWARVTYVLEWIYTSMNTEAPATAAPTPAEPTASPDPAPSPGEAPGPCGEEAGPVDAGGFGCEDGYPSADFCNYYDDTDFTASDMCNICSDLNGTNGSFDDGSPSPSGSGSMSPSPSCAPSPSPSPSQSEKSPSPTPASCKSTAGGAVDLGEYSCESGYAMWGYCGYYDDSDFTAYDMCCGCGGGERDRSPSASPSQSPSNPAWQEPAHRVASGTEPTKVVISGSLGFQASGISKAQAEEAVKASLSESLGLRESHVHTSATPSTGRRLAGGVETWTVEYEVQSPEAGLAELSEKVDALSAAIGDGGSSAPSSFVQTLVGKLAAAAGTDAPSLQESFKMGAFSKATSFAKTTVGATTTADDRLGSGNTRQDASSDAVISAASATPCRVAVLLAMASAVIPGLLSVA